MYVNYDEISPDVTLKHSPLSDLLSHIRPAVRRERPYLVGRPPDVRVKLNQNESPYDLPDDLKRELLDDYLSVAFNRYPDEQPEELRRVLAEQLDHDPAGIIVGNGSNELTYTFGLTMIAPGTPVVLPRPMFSLYEKVVRLHEGALTSVPPRDDLRFDTEAMVAAIERVQPSLVVLATPNNPTGRAMTIGEVERVVQATPGFVVVDEAYVDFCEEPSAVTLLGAHPNVIVLRTFSKAWGLAGLRLGYLVGHPDVVREIFKARLPFMVDRLAERAALALLRRPDLLADRVRRLKQATERLAGELGALEGIEEVVPSQTNFVIFKAALEPDVLMDRLATFGVLVRNMGGYPELQGYLRVNAGTPDENKAFVAALKGSLSQT